MQVETTKQQHQYAHSVLESLQQLLFGEGPIGTDRTLALLRQIEPGQEQDFVDGAVPLCQRLYAQGRTHDALPISLACTRMAGNDDSGRRAWRVATTAGIMLADTGDCAGALAQHARALQFAEARADTQDQARAWNNAGVALMLAGAYSVANKCFERTLDLEPNAPAFVIYGAYTNTAQCELHLGDLRTGVIAAHEGLRYETEAFRRDSPYSAVFLRNNYARLLIRLKRLRRARQIADQAVSLASVLYLPRALIEAEVTSAAVAVAVGDVEAGHAALRELLPKARQNPVALPDTLIALAQAERALGSADRAAVYLRELNDHVYRQAALHARKYLAIAAEEPARETPFGTLWPPMAEWDTFERLAMRASMSAHGDPWRTTRVGDLVEQLALEVGYEPGMAKEVGLAARLQDVGMLACTMPPWHQAGCGQTDSEAPWVRDHVLYGRDLLESSEHPRAIIGADIAYYHHEHWDGSGYPDGLRGNAIPLAARLGALADAFEQALGKDSTPLNVATACDSIRQEAHTRFDPALVERLIRSAVSGRIHHYLRSEKWNVAVRTEDLNDLMHRFARRWPT